MLPQQSLPLSIPRGGGPTANSRARFRTHSSCTAACGICAMDGVRGVYIGVREGVGRVRVCAYVGWATVWMSLRVCVCVCSCGQDPLHRCARVWATACVRRHLLMPLYALYEHCMYPGEMVRIAESYKGAAVGGQDSRAPLSSKQGALPLMAPPTRPLTQTQIIPS